MIKDEDFKLIKTQTFVLKVYIHCEGCSKKVKKVLQNIEGVYTTTVDAVEQKVTVTGNVPSADILVKKLLKAGKHAELWPQKSNNSNKGKQQQDEAKPPPPQQGKQQQKEKKEEDGGDGSGKKGGKKGGGGGEKTKGEDAEESAGEGSKGGGGNGNGNGNANANGGGNEGGGKKKKGGKGGGGGGNGGGEGMSILEGFDPDDFPVLGQVAPGGAFGPMPHAGFRPVPHPGFGPMPPPHGGFGPMPAGGVNPMAGGEWPGMGMGMPPASMNRPVVQYVQYVPQYPHVHTQQAGNSADYASHMFNDENTGSCSVM